MTLPHPRLKAWAAALLASLASAPRGAAFTRAATARANAPIAPSSSPAPASSPPSVVAASARSRSAPG